MWQMLINQWNRHASLSCSKSSYLSHHPLWKHARKLWLLTISFLHLILSVSCHWTDIDVLEHLFLFNPQYLKKNVCKIKVIILIIVSMVTTFPLSCFCTHFWIQKCSWNFSWTFLVHQPYMNHSVYKTLLFF